MAVFAPRVPIVEPSAVQSAVNKAAAVAYFGFRVAHYLIHLAAVPVIRTVVFLGGWACQMALGLSVLGLL